MTASSHQTRPLSPAATQPPFFAQVRAGSLALAAPLSEEDCQVQSMQDASPVKWHLAHTTWFFETFVLERFEPEFRPFDSTYRVLFNSYYHGVGPQYPRARRGLITRPTLDRVRHYREQVDARIEALLAARRGDAALADIVTLGLQHEQQHQELLLTDIKHALSFNPAVPAYARRWPIGAVRPLPLQWIGHRGGLVEIGHDPERDGPFCFDNETPRHRHYLTPFEIASRPLTNGEYQAFIADGGYQRPELWLSMGWDWVCQGNDEGPRQAPLYWRLRDGRWVNYTLQGEVAIDSHTPVCHLSYFEAEACARWAGARLPSEAEWEFAARQLDPEAARHGNFAERGAFHPLPQADDGRSEPVQMFGDVWEWTQSSYTAFPGFRPAAGAVGEYNGKFMCDQWVLRGGSCATPAGHVRASYRNFFPAHAQWQFSGLRLARDLDD